MFSSILSLLIRSKVLVDKFCLSFICISFSLRTSISFYIALWSIEALTGLFHLNELFDIPFFPKNLATMSLLEVGDWCLSLFILRPMTELPPVNIEWSSRGVCMLWFRSWLKWPGRCPPADYTENYCLFGRLVLLLPWDDVMLFCITLTSYYLLKFVDSSVFSLLASWLVINSTGSSVLNFVSISCWLRAFYKLSLPTNLYGLRLSMLLSLRGDLLCNIGSLFITFFKDEK